MSTILFVHGTGQRSKSVEKSLVKIREQIGKHSDLASFALESCLWGDPLGIQPSSGLSIPEYANDGPNRKAVSPDVELWANLYAEPLYELRLLALQQSDNAAPPEPPGAQRLHEYVSSFDVTAELRELLRKGDVESIFLDAHAEVVRSTAFQEMMRGACDPLGPFQDALARALIAMAIALYLEANGGERSAIQEDAALRDRTVKLVRAGLGPTQTAIFDSIVERFQKLQDKIYWGTPSALLARANPMWGLVARRRRGDLMDGASPIVGDILLYQVRGNRIRDFLRTRIHEVQPPVVILAHSLGGVAAVDLLVQEDLSDRVALLVTAGSQAPYFYEINALASLEYHKDARLPAHFPRWANIYDRRDLLSFVGARIFAGRISDHEVDSRLPFPISHGAYWNNEETFRVVAEHVRTNMS